jgi:trehalose synthase
VVSLRTVHVPPRHVARLADVVGTDRFERLLTAARDIRARLGRRTVWNVNSTATGGGVAEMLQVLVGYVRDLGIDIRWSVISGDAAFFALTKRLHNRLHGEPDGLGLGEDEAAHYADVLAANAEALLMEVRPGDLVLLHDPQTAGLARALVRHGARVVWRCHIGADRENDATRSAWRFLRPHVEQADAFVFSRRQYPPAWLPTDRTWIVPPSIDPLSPKNQDLKADAVTAILGRIGCLDHRAEAGTATFSRRDGTMSEVARAASVVADRLPGVTDPVVLQVSRWDRLKDMAGVMSGFASHVGAPACLILAGPSVENVDDDPEGAAVYAECVSQWKALPRSVRARVLLATLPLNDVDENAVMVNALQRHSTVTTQKSLAEGFGLTVAEAMWKGRPVVGSRVGGIQDQIVDGTGVLVPDPTDLTYFGTVLRDLIADPERAGRMGAAAQAHVRAQYVGDHHLLRYAELFGALLTRS